jgi:hypothetical protein
MRATYHKNLRQDVRNLIEGLQITRLYGDLTETERKETERLSDELERFENRVLYAEEEGG